MDGKDCHLQAEKKYLQSELYVDVVIPFLTKSMKYCMY
jgi:hypothetical protein